jgi:hypothetical protein
VTSRWAVDIAPHRDLKIRWRPISLLIKNDVQPDSPRYANVKHTHDLLRVLESVRAAEGDGPIDALYTAMGERIHNGGAPMTPAIEVLRACGIDESHAAAAADEQWDEAIRVSMKEGLALTGDDVGTPILGFDNSAGKRVGYFGPVITKRPPFADALDLWDGLMLIARVPGFWELKRIRTERPDFTAPSN